ncbi:MAG TPA: NAD-dependent succinate-semialdehyde dehydrogenase [Candidatus Bathyarchaeia archaeon]|nr:NAD-dependent succinate-semialdehyde dehydrogenase [Candidatus Bathyarchaeia archaeon]
MPIKTSRKWIETVNPANGRTLRRFRTSTKTDVGKAVERARKAFEKWRQLTPAKRAPYLERAAQILRSQKEKLGRIITLEMGKTIKESIPEIVKCAWALEYYAENGQKFLNPEFTKTDATDSYVAFEPLGVVASIMPWNFPLWQCIRFTAPSLMAGNTVVFKPSSVTPQSGLALQSAFDSSGLPSGCFNTVLGSSEVAAYMLGAPTTAVSFTGSVSAGRQVAGMAGGGLKKFVLELGGSDPFIVLEDANVEAASSGAVAGRFINCGQSCIASKRFFVAKKVADEFLDQFIAKTRSLRIGDPIDPETDLGPMVSEAALRSLDQQVKDSVSQGARVELGGERLKRKGSYYAPTILTDVKTDMPVMREEVFGPVAPVMVVKDEQEAVKYANQTEFGLGASVWGQDIRRSEKVARQITSGLVTVNNIVVSDPRMPFGGVKHSGIGRELSRYGILEFTNIKSVRLYEKSPIALTHVE